MSRILIAAGTAVTLLAGIASANAAPAVTTYGPYYGPYGGHAGAVAVTNPVTGNEHLYWGAVGPNGRTTAGRVGVYHGACGTAWSAVRRGPAGGVWVNRGAVGNGAC